MLSQAMESVTRAFYTRSDLDLLLSSPAQAPKIFAVRIATIALSVMAMAALLAGPFINVPAAEGCAHWLRAYGAVAAIAVGLTTALFRTIGPRRTRLVAQIVAAVIGAIPDPHGDTKGLFGAIPQCVSGSSPRPAAPVRQIERGSLR
jgi:ABC-2 type transport system permease protein